MAGSALDQSWVKALQEDLMAAETAGWDEVVPCSELARAKPR